METNSETFPLVPPTVIPNKELSPKDRAFLELKAKLQQIDLRSVPWFRVLGLGSSAIALLFIFNAIGSMQHRQMLQPTRSTSLINEQNNELNQRNTFDVAANVVLGKPLNFTDNNGNFTPEKKLVLGVPIDVTAPEQIVTDARVVKVAADIIRRDQLNELLKLKAQDLQIRIMSGTQTNGHICFGQSFNQCISTLRNGFKIQFNDATLVNNLNLANDTMWTLQALDMVENGDIETSLYDSDLIKITQGRYEQAASMIRTSSAGGASENIASILEEISKAKIQRQNQR